MNAIIGTVRLGGTRTREEVRPRQRRVRVIGLLAGVSPRCNARAIDFERDIRGVLEDCLAPYLADGDVIWFDRTLEPHDGDVVVCLIWYEAEDGRSWSQREAVKQLMIRDGKRFLCCVEGSLPADEIAIFGVVTAWVRRRWWRRPSMRKMRFSGPATVSGEFEHARSD